MREKKCLFCGKMFFGRENKVYCSKECRLKAMNASYQPKETHIVCKVCGKTFTTMNSRRLYCSEECRAVGRRESNRKSAELLRQRGRKMQGTGEIGYSICPVCRKPFPSYANKKYCSEVCEKIDENRKRRAKKIEPPKPKKRPLVSEKCERCRQCYYFSRNSPFTCDYCFIEGRGRGEPVSEHCRKFVKFRKQSRAIRRGKVALKM